MPVDFQPATASPTPAPAPSAKPKLETPVEPPHPILQAAGFQGGIQAFNQKVAQIDEAHRLAYGTPPSPGLALDVARSDVQPQDYPRLFAIPKDPTVARLQGTVNLHRQQNPYDYMVQRADGAVQPDNPIRHLVQAHTAPDYQQLQKQYPMVMEGALPIKNLNEFYGALNFLNKPIPQASTNQNLLAADPLARYVGPTTQDTQQARRAVFTIKQAQTDLNREMGTSLPVTGVLNQDWVSALHNWQRSKAYFQKQLSWQAQQSGFGKDVGAYVKAWNAKEKAVQHGLYGHFLAAMPLPLFGHGGFWNDVASIPGYLEGASDNPLNIGLHELTKTAGLALDTFGGTVAQAKADSAAATTFATYMAGLHGKSTYEEALHKAREQLQANPTWLRALAGGFLPTEEKGFLANLDQGFLNPLGDLILLRKPAFTGETVGAGDLAAASRSDYLNATAGWAFQDLKKYGADGVGRASARLERGSGANELVARAAKLIQRGDMTEEQFAQHVAELYATGHTTLTIGGKTADISGPLLGSLRAEKLPTPGVPGRAWLTTKSYLRDWLDQFDQNSGPFGRLATDRSKSFALSLRSAVSHYVPRRSGYLDGNLPEQVFNFVVKNKLGVDTAALANKLESRIVRFQGTENITGIQQVERQLQKLYYEKFPTKAGPPETPFNATLATEAPSVFHFPGGGEPAINNATGAIAVNAAKVNNTLNRLAILHARVILSGLNPLSLVGGFSLFWKHAFGDSLRVEAGGGGIITGLSREVRQAKREIAGLANSDPEASRLLGSFRERAVKGETRWALNRGGENVYTKTFRTGDVKGGRLANQALLDAAGGYLRRRLDDQALGAYQQGGDALTQLILHDKTYSGLWKAAKRDSPDLSAEAYAGIVADEFRGVEAALADKGLTLDDAKAFYNHVRGAHADTQLGKWIKKNGLDFEVKQGLVEARGTLDDLSGRWVGNVIMAPNKLNRGRFAENVLAQTYADLRKGGFDEKTALRTSMDVAAKLTKYHMLDFANRLQIEQDLRWLSYFATKHRLYWKWVLGTFVRHPGYAAAVSDFAQTLNQSGGVTLPFNALGQKWQIPLERLVWVPGREYDETSPLALAVLNFIKSGGNLDQVVKGATGTQGNVLTRSDTATFLGTKLLKIETGAAPATYGYAYAGLDKTTADHVKRAINEYQLDYYREHGHYAPEGNVVRLVLLHQMGQEYWRANLPLPVVPYQPVTEQDKLLQQYMALIDPKQRREFLDKHPGFSDNFGVYQDPSKYLHNQQFFARWAKAVDAYKAARSHLYAEARKTGVWTTDLERQRRELSAALERTRNQLLVDDARQSGIDTHGLVPNGDTVPYGPWGKLVNKDPQFDPSHFLSTFFPHLDKSQQDNVIGPLQRQMQQELSLLNDPKYVAASNYTPEEVKTRKRELLQSLEVFNSYPTDALGQLQHTYQTRYVNAYWKTYDQKYTAIGKLPSGERATADAAFRAWRDSQDKPVVINGVTFPPPLRMAWAMLDPATRQQRLAYLAGKNVQDLANYELDLLDIKHPPNVSEAFAAIAKAKDEYHAAYPGQALTKQQLLDVAKQIDKQPGYRGFYAYYVNTVTQPRIRQFEQTSLYREMPADIRGEFDRYIGSAAIEVARGIAANGHSSYYGEEWRKAVQDQIEPWLADPAQKQLRDYLAEFGPNFLNSLVSR